MAAEIIAELRANEPGREVAVDIAPGLRATGDPSLVRNLLQNLIGNAWKFTRDRVDARVEFGRDSEGAFFVRDNGAGFAQEYVDKLFRPFQRLHSQEQFAGDGIGLASVKRIVERHGGTIRAEGHPGQGATFRFTLPEPDED
jgi:signal transduction histidine kinase